MSSARIDHIKGTIRLSGRDETTQAALRACTHPLLFAASETKPALQPAAPTGTTGHSTHPSLVRHAHRRDSWHGATQRLTPKRTCPWPAGLGRNLRSKTRWFAGFCNSHHVSHFAALFIDARAEISIAESRVYPHGVQQHSTLPSPMRRSCISFFPLARCCAGLWFIHPTSCPLIPKVSRERRPGRSFSHFTGCSNRSVYFSVSTMIDRLRAPNFRS